MTDAIRQSVSELLYPGPHTNRLGNVDNAGLELSRYLKAQKNGHPRGPNQPPHPEREDLLDRIAKAATPAGYKLAYDRWKGYIERLPGVKAQATFRADGRLIVGIGAESVLENAITVNRIWGVPMIPGSALKGLANHYAKQVLSNTDHADCGDNLRPAKLPEGAKPGTKLPLNAHGILFGTTDDAAYVNWLDAWYMPKTRTVEPPFKRDVITNHHPRYYGKRGTDETRPPWDFDDPNPVPFISASGEFLIVLQGPDQPWVDFAMKVLAAALEHAGIGAKTSAGYGRGEVTGNEIAQPPTGTGTGDDGASAIVDDLLKEISDTRGRAALSDKAHGWYTAWKRLPSEHRLLVAQSILAQLGTAQKAYDRVLSKGYGKELEAFVADHAGDSS